MARGLTKRQHEVLDFVKGYIDEHGFGPSLRDICAFFSINGPNNARKHLDSLEKKGFIKREPRKSRAIEIWSRQPEAVLQIWKITAARVVLLACCQCAYSWYGKGRSAGISH